MRRGGVPGHRYRLTARDLCKTPLIFLHFPDIKPKECRGFALWAAFYTPTPSITSKNVSTASPSPTPTVFLTEHSSGNTSPAAKPATCATTAAVPPILFPPFKAILPGQWHSLSEPEYSLITRIDFQLFCCFDDFRITDHSTLCRFRNRPAQDDTLIRLLELMNRRLTEKSSTSKKPPQPLSMRPSSKIGKIRLTPANAHECKHPEPLLADTTEGSTVYADKGYDSRENRQHLAEYGLKDGIMQKAHRGRPLSREQKVLSLIHI